MYLVGTAGFKYEYWRDVFYPQNLASKNMLAYYATQFQTLEVDYTYYRMPYARTLAAMSDKVPAEFQFCIKAHKSMTHEISETQAERQETFSQFMSAVEPLRERAQLGCVLVQFPWSFKPAQHTHAYIQCLPRLCDGAPLVIEFRNNMWATSDTFALLEDCGIGFCCVDEPRLKGLMPPLARATSHVGYVRFHGRNAASWWKHNSVSERYNYLYSEQELLEWVPKIRLLGESCSKVFVAFNNCYEGKAPTNARMMQQILTE